MRSRARTRLGISITLVSAAAWTVLLVNPESMGHAHPVTGPVVSMIFEMLPSLLPGWVLMLVAMMSPKLFAPILDVIQGSFKHRRARAVALFTVAYIAVWTVAGCVLLAATMLLLYLSAPHSHLLALGAGLVVLVWQCSPAKQVDDSAPSVWVPGRRIVRDLGALPEVVQDRQQGGVEGIFAVRASPMWLT